MGLLLPPPCLLLLSPLSPLVSSSPEPQFTITVLTVLPLPSLLELENLLDEDGQAAWRRLLQAERTALALSANAPVARYNDLLVSARVIGFFILDFKRNRDNISFADHAHLKLVQQVQSCWAPSAGEDECLKKVIDLGSHLQNHLIRACMLRVLLSFSSV